MSEKLTITAIIVLLGLIVWAVFDTLPPESPPKDWCRGSGGQKMPLEFCQ